jgi:phage terminase small subunit
MAALDQPLTLRQERFCEAYIQNDGNASAAYRAAYKAEGNENTIAKSAHKILHRPNVKGRIAELRMALVNASKVTLESLLAELEEARGVGRSEGQASAMVSATMSKAKLTGLDAPESGDKDDLTKVLSDLIAKLPG